MENTSSQLDIKITADEDALLIVAGGNYSLTNANHLFKLAIDNGVLHNKSKILIDVANIKGTISTFDRFQFSQFLSDYRIKHGSGIVNKIAVVGKEPVVDEQRFGETVAVNRGTNIRVFTDRSTASAWLNNKK